MEKLKNVPNLRFPEFNGNWIETTIEENFTFKNGINKEKEYFGSGTPIINFTDVYNNRELTKDNVKGLVTISDKEIENYSAYKGDVFFTRTSETIEDIGMSATLVEDIPNCIFSGFVLRARPTNSNLNSDFNKYVFSTESIRKEIVTKSSYTTRALTSGTLLNKVIFYHPKELLEQQKIASFLTSVDERIAQLTKKKALLEQYKKGVMQKIFSQEIRFKDDNGKEFPEWEEKRFGDITYKVGEKNKENIQYPIYSINNKEGFIPQSDQFEGMDSNDRGYDISLYKIVYKHTFAYNPARINVGSVGFSGELDKVLISSLYVCFKTIDNVNDSFILQYLKSYSFNKSVLRSVEGGVREYLFYENFSGIKIMLPSYDEQNKITNFLSAIDKRIERVDKQLEQTKLWKKGLLQQMFC